MEKVQQIYSPKYTMDKAQQPCSPNYTMNKVQRLKSLKYTMFKIQLLHRTTYTSNHHSQNQAQFNSGRHMQKQTFPILSRKCISLEKPHIFIKRYINDKNRSDFYQFSCMGRFSVVVYLREHWRYGNFSDTSVRREV